MFTFKGSDYSDKSNSPTSTPEIFTFKYSEDLNAVFVEDLSKHCCRPRRVACFEMKKKGTDQQCECKSNPGRTLCDEMGETYSCSSLKQYVKERGEQQIEQLRIQKAITAINDKLAEKKPESKG